MEIHHDELRRTLTRREVLAKMSTGLMAITVQSIWGEISPAQARVKGVALRNLTAVESRTLEALADVLLPGAEKAGIAHYVDDQLSRQNPLLFLKYMDYPGSYIDFYKQGLGAVESQSARRYGRAFDKLGYKQKTAIARELSLKNPPGWKGPPGPLFYFVARNDAVDVYYGTVEGFKKLGVPYMAHILPAEKW